MWSVAACTTRFQARRIAALQPHPTVAGPGRGLEEEKNLFAETRRIAGDFPVSSAAPKKKRSPACRQA